LSRIVVDNWTFIGPGDRIYAEKNSLWLFQNTANGMSAGGWPFYSNRYAKAGLIGAEQCNPSEGNGLRQAVGGEEIEEMRCGATESRQHARKSVGRDTR
jgi:hypothetical protein